MIRLIQNCYGLCRCHLVVVSLLVVVWWLLRWRLWLRSRLVVVVWMYVRCGWGATKSRHRLHRIARAFPSSRALGGSGSAPEAALSGKVEAGVLEMPLRRRHLPHASIASPQTRPRRRTWKETDKTRSCLPSVAGRQIGNNLFVTTHMRQYHKGAFSDAKQQLLHKSR